MSCDLQTHEHEYTEGDTLPDGILIMQGVNLTGITVTALVERPDGTGFERPGIQIETDTIKFTWTDTDWLKGCSQISFKFDDGAGGVETVGMGQISTREKPSTT